MFSHVLFHAGFVSSNLTKVSVNVAAHVHNYIIFIMTRLLGDFMCKSYV